MFVVVLRHWSTHADLRVLRAVREIDLPLKRCVTCAVYGRHRGLAQDHIQTQCNSSAARQCPLPPIRLQLEAILSAGCLAGCQGERCMMVGEHMC